MHKRFNIFRPILAILVLFIPLYPKFPLMNFKGIYVALRLEDIVILISLIIWLIWELKNKLPILKQKITYLFIAYFISINLSTIIAIFIYQTTPTSILLLHLFRHFEYISLFFITIYGLKNKDDLNYLYISLLIALVGVAIYGYGQRYFSFPIISTMNEEFSRGQLLRMDVWTRISSTFAGHYDLAAYLSLVLVLVISVSVIIKNKLLKVISIILFLIGFDLLTRTASRVSIFALWGGGVVSLFLIKKYLWIIPLSILIIYGMFNSTDLNQRLIATISTFKPKVTQNLPKPTTLPLPTKIIAINTTTVPVKLSTPVPTVVRHQSTDEFIPVDSDVGVARSGEIRFNVEWPRAISAFKKNIFFGTGLGSISLATDNDYLRLLGESGLFGLFTFLLIPFMFVIKSIKLYWAKKSNTFTKLQLALVGVTLSALANAIFIDIFEASKIAYTFWILMAIFYQLIQFNSSKND